MTVSRGRSGEVVCEMNKPVSNKWDKEWKKVISFNNVYFLNHSSKSEAAHLCQADRFQTKKLKLTIFLKMCLISETFTFLCVFISKSQWILCISLLFVSMVKFQSFALFPVDHLSHPVMSALLYFICQFAAFTYYASYFIIISYGKLKFDIIR